MTSQNPAQPKETTTEPSAATPKVTHVGRPAPAKPAVPSQQKFEIRPNTLSSHDAVGFWNALGTQGRADLDEYAKAVATRQAVEGDIRNVISSLRRSNRLSLRANPTNEALTRARPWNMSAGAEMVSRALLGDANAFRAIGGIALFSEAVAAVGLAASKTFPNDPRFAGPILAGGMGVAFASFLALAKGREVSETGQQTAVGATDIDSAVAAEIRAFRKVSQHLQANFKVDAGTNDHALTALTKLYEAERRAPDDALLQGMRETPRLELMALDSGLGL